MRKALGLTPERFSLEANQTWDECDNAFTRPRDPVKLGIYKF